MSRPLFLLALSLLAAPAISRPITHTHPAPRPALPKRLLFPPDLVSRWPGEGSAKDTVGGHDGTAYGVTYVPGKVGQAFAFSGTDSYVGIPDAPAFDFAPAGQFTLTAWVYPEPTGHYQAVLDKATVGGDWKWGILIDPSGHFYTGHAAKDIAQSTTVIQGRTWYYVAVTYDNGTWKMYVNGVLENQASEAPLTTPEGDLALGHKGGSPAQTADPDWYHGLIDEPSVYDQALTATEIAAAYQHDRPGILTRHNNGRAIGPPVGEVELSGIEPLTSSMRMKRSPS